MATFLGLCTRPSSAHVLSCSALHHVLILFEGTVHFTVQNGPVDFSDSAVQAEMDRSLDLFRDNEFVVADTVSSWWEELKEMNGSSTVVLRPPRFAQSLLT